MKTFFSIFTTVIFLTFLTAFSTAGTTAPQDLPEKVEAFMAALIETLDVVPGYAIAIAGPEQALFVKGYGTTKAENGAPVDSHTQFYIASSTKSLTALAIASLAERGLLDLDTPIKNYLPSLAGAPAGEVTLSQLLSHSHGLMEEALTLRTAFTGDYTQAILINIIRNLPLSETPEAFAYSNTGYVIASLVLEQTFGKSWKTIVEEEVLNPAGMTATTAYVSALQDDYARPHSWYGVKNSFPLVKQDSTMHAAGGHFSSAADMARWLQVQLSGGSINGEAIFAPGLVAGTHLPRVELDAEFYTYKRHHYGFGWYQVDYNGMEMYHHFGSFSGYRSHVSFIPELGIGVAVLINDTSRPGFNLPDMIANYVYDLASGKETPETPYQAEIAKIAEMIAPMAGHSPPDRPRNAPGDEAKYVGSYSNPEFGTFHFEMKDGELQVSIGNLSSKTTYMDDGAIRMELTPYQGTLGVFQEDENGTITGFRFRGASYTRLD